jgi:hypothetical protein
MGYESNKEDRQNIDPPYLYGQKKVENGEIGEIWE